MSNINNRKITIKDLCNVTISWIKSNASNTQSGWRISDIAPSTIRVVAGIGGKHNSQCGSDYTRIDETAFNAVSEANIKEQLQSFLRQVYSSSLDITDETSVLSSDKLNDLENAISVFIFSKVKTYIFDGTFMNTTTKRILLYDTSASVPTNLPLSTKNNNIISANFIQHMLTNLNNNLQYNNNYKQIRYSESYFSSSSCSSSSCSSSSSRFLAHIQ